MRVSTLQYRRTLMEAKEESKVSRPAADRMVLADGLLDVFLKKYQRVSTYGRVTRNTSNFSRGILVFVSLSLTHSYLLSPSLTWRRGTTVKALVVPTTTTRIPQTGKSESAVCLIMLARGADATTAVLLFIKNYTWLTYD